MSPPLSPQRQKMIRAPPCVAYCLPVSAWADGTVVFSGGLATKGAARVEAEAEAVAWPPERAAFASARAKSIHLAESVGGVFREGWRARGRGGKRGAGVG